MDLVTRTIRYQLAIALPPTIFLALYVEPLLDLWIGSRLTTDPNLVAAGMGSETATEACAQMIVVVLLARLCRSAFFGLERILYGIGKVESYAWFAKWSTVITMGLGAAALALSGAVLAAPLSLLVAYFLFLGVVLRAAHQKIAFPLVRTLRWTAPRPLIANGLFFGALLLMRPSFQGLTVGSLGYLLGVAGFLYAALAFFVIAQASERRRLVEIVTARAE